jgi:hypothetical protein
MVLTVLAVGAFLIGLLAVTGVELLKGSTLIRGETGTSLGRVVDPRPGSPDTAKPTETAEPTETETATPEPTDETEEPPPTDEREGDPEPGADTDTTRTRGSATPATARATRMRGRRLRLSPVAADRRSGTRKSDRATARDAARGPMRSSAQTRSERPASAHRVRRRGGNGLSRPRTTGDPSGWSVGFCHAAHAGSVPDEQISGPGWRSPSTPRTTLYTATGIDPA